MGNLKTNIFNLECGSKKTNSGVVLALCETVSPSLMMFTPCYLAHELPDILLFPPFYHR